MLEPFFTYSVGVSSKNESNEKIILITSQRLIRDFIWNHTIGFVAKIEREKLNIEIWYKPHPFLYSDINIYYYNPCSQIISVKMENIEQLFPTVAAQTSVYSVTLVDGLNFGIHAYCIGHFAYSTYIQKYIEKNFNHEVNLESLPLNLKRV